MAAEEILSAHRVESINNNVNCHHNTATSSKQTFAGWMAYNRFWFKKDLYAITIGGGAMANPGRYLTLLPPINGADAISGSPYFTQNPGDPFKAWDTSITFNWMPRQYITFLTEFGYRHANVPYWSGRGGITPGDNGFPSTIPNPGGGSVIAGTQHSSRARSCPRRLASPACPEAQDSVPICGEMKPA